MTTPPFPNSPAPAWYRSAIWNEASSKRNGVHYVGDAVSIKLSAALSINVTYVVRDYFGNSVSTGSVSSGVQTFTVTAPGGGWKPGWYRLYLSGASSDTNFFNSCGATNFCVVRSDSHFVAMPAGNTVGGSQVASDMVMKGVMGVGTSRMSIYDATDPTFDPGSGLNLAGCVSNLARTNTYWVAPGAPYADSARPRYAWTDFPDGGYDYLDIGSGQVFLCKDETINGSQVFVELVAGTNPGTFKARVYFPNATTLVETFDNLDNTGTDTWQAAINGVSNYVVYHWYGVGVITTHAKTAIGRSHWNGVVSVVSTLFPLGCTHFEGPRNEPEPNSQDRGVIAHLMRLFAGAVHAGNPSAKAMGPTFVDLTWHDTRGWYAFFNAGGHNYCDAISFHAYNGQTNGDINLGRNTLDTFVALMDQFGVNLPLWQTESTHSFTSVYRIYHPRRARVYLLQTLQQEQYGVPREQNNPWYDTSIGYWDYPAWLENGDGSLNPSAVMYRVLAEETWGKPFDHALDFDEPGNAMMIGNVYTGSSSAVVVIQATSFMDEGSVTLLLSGVGAGPVTVVDAFGVTSSQALVSEQCTLTLTDAPVYIRLPLGVTVSVLGVNGWASGPNPSISSGSLTRTIAGVNYPAIGDGGYMSDYAADVGIAPPGFQIVPSAVQLNWSTNQTMNRVVIWCGPSWQSSGELMDFTVSTSANLVDWTVRATVSKSAPNFFEFGTDANNAGCFLETYGNEQWVFDVGFAPVSCRGLRINVTKASFGGEPLSTTTYGTQEFGQGNPVQAYRIQEVGVFHSALVGQPPVDPPVVPPPPPGEGLIPIARV